MDDSLARTVSRPDKVNKTNPTVVAAIYGLMEDAATAEISRTSIWQWIRHGKTLSTGEKVTKALFEEMLDEELQVIQKELGDKRFQSGRFREAAELMRRITTQDELIEFLTIPGYQLLD